MGVDGVDDIWILTGSLVQMPSEWRKITGGIGRSYQPLSDGHLGSAACRRHPKARGLELDGAIFSRHLFHGPVCF